MPGEKPLWIDPTSSYTAAGQLPLADQGRLALIVDPETQALKMTPLSAAKANTIRRKIRIDIAANEKSKVTYTLTKIGITAAEDRQWYSETPRGDIEKVWQTAATERFGDAELTSLDFSNPMAFDKPFQVKAEFANSGRGVVGSDEVIFGLNTIEIFDNLPWYLQFEETEPEVGDPASAFKRARRNPLGWPMVHVREDEYRVVVPDGFELKSLPEDTSQRFGDAVYSKRFERDGETVVATFRFDTGNSTLTSSQVTSLRKTIGPLVIQVSESGWDTLLNWENIADKHIARGDYDAGYSQYRKLISAHPRESLYRDGYVNALLQGGFASEARRVARQAVADLPNSADAYSMLGFVMFHDELCRQMTHGFDQRECIKAFEKCLELAPENQLNRWNLAVALEHDRYGNRYVPGENLKRSMALYREMLGAEGTPGDPANNLAFCLYFSDQLDELAKLIENSETVQIDLQLAVLALRDGTAAAHRKAQRLTNDKQQQLGLLLAAGDQLNRGRHYKLACELCEAGAGAAADPRLLQRSLANLSRLKRAEEVRIEADQPEYAVQKVIGIIASHGGKSELVTPFTVNDATESIELIAWEGGLRVFRLLSLQTDAPPARREDVVSMLQFEKNGSPEIGFQIRISDSPPFYVVPGPVAPGNPRYKILLSGNANSELGARALDLLEGGHTDAARQWLDWAKGEVNPGQFLNPFSGIPFGRIWTGTKKDDIEAMRCAAAALAVRGSASKRAGRILEAAVESEQAALRKVQLQRALCESHLKHEEFDELLEVALPLVERYAVDELRHYVIRAYMELGRTDDVKAAAIAWRKKAPDAAAPLQVLVELANQAGEHDDAYQMVLKALEDEPNLVDYNRVAWQALYLQPLPETALVHARRACELSGFSSSPALHTLATVHAARGELSDANRALRQAVENRGDRQLQQQDWYVIGRMAEHAGLLQAARDAYAKVHPMKTSDVYRLAQIRLKTMDK